ncbi:unnamed protein product, partial [Pylaiella littoralis]
MCEVPGAGKLTVPVLAREDIGISATSVTLGRGVMVGEEETPGRVNSPPQLLVWDGRPAGGARRQEHKVRRSCDTEYFIIISAELSRRRRHQLCLWCDDGDLVIISAVRQRRPRHHPGRRTGRSTVTKPRPTSAVKIN